MSGDTLHRHDPGGPTATVTCDGNQATATWLLPAGQVAADHPELNAGGYVYFTTDAAPTRLIDGLGDHHRDFSGVPLEVETAEQISVEVEFGVPHRAHLLVAYEDGPAWHNDTVFTCEKPPVEVSSTTLPFTGPSLEGLVLVAVLLVAAGVGLLRLLEGGG